MIKIVSKNTVKKEKKQEFINTAKELIEKSRAEEGCIYYTLNESLDGKYLTFIEEWKDEKSIEIHNNSEHFKTIVPKLAKFKEGASDLVLYKEI